MRIEVAEAIARLGRGEVVALPTETVYGLAAGYTQKGAIEQIFVLKGRPRDNPLIVHLAHQDQLLDVVEEVPLGGRELMKAFWPGPLTLVLPARKDRLVPSITAGLPDVAVRLPRHPLMRAVLEGAGPVVAPSANLSGRPSATAPGHVERDFGGNFPVLDGGLCECGLESTILLWKGDSWVIGRQGALSAQELGRVLGREPSLAHRDPLAPPACPGSLYRHYAPTCRLKRGDAAIAPRVLGFSDRVYQGELVSMGISRDPHATAAGLYAALRRLDEQGWSEVMVDLDFPQDGLWRTIRERLIRAMGESGSAQGVECILGQ